jgi:tol-pal system protein YbgF
MDANALFGSNGGIFATYAKYVLNDTLIGTSPQQNASLALYLPFSFISSGTGFRISEIYIDAISGKNLSTRVDFSTRLLSVQMLLSYSESQIGANLNPLTVAGNGTMTATAMYMVPGMTAIPKFLQSFLLRSVATYDMKTKTMYDVSFQVSKTLMQIFQFNVGFIRNFATHNTSIEAGLIMDLNFTRTSSVFDFSNDNSTSRQSIYGSVAFDRGKPFLSNREQIGKGGINVFLFVDNNVNGKYDAGDELIPARGVKVDGMGKVELGRDSIIRVTQLESYFRYNLEVDRSQVDPNLVPTIDKFSFVVDPNQMRRIEIPFYRGGTISGNVYFEKDGMRTPLSGGRIFLRATNGNFGDTLHTFSDGGFYAMNVAPGSYTLKVDPMQLKFIEAIQKDMPLNVTIHHSQQGDIIEDLTIVCESLNKVISPPQEAESTKAIAEDTVRNSLTARPGEREKIDTTIKKENTEQILVPVQKESREPVVQKEIAETVLQPVTMEKRDSLLREEYSYAVSLFREKKYDEAAVKFNDLLEKGIEKTFAGNCEYWIGECSFATRDYSHAIEHFQKVISIESSAKKPDAYYMLGRSYDQTGDLEKARDAYQALNDRYPANVHAKRVRTRLKAINSILDKTTKIEND